MPGDDNGAKRPGSSDDADAPVAAQGPGRRKRAWSAPRVSSGKLFESNSLACGKATPHFEQCLQNPTRS